MSPLSRSVRTALMVAVLLLIPAMAQAQNKDGSAEVGLAYTFTHFDTQTSLAYRVSPSIMLGYNFTKRHGGELVFTSTTATPRKGESFQVDVDVVRVGYIFNAYPKPKIVSFFRFGFGAFVLSPEAHTSGPARLEEGKSSFMIYSGGGFRWFLSPKIGIRLAGSLDFVDSGKGFANSDVQAAGDLGVVFLMGGHEPAEKPAE